MIGVSLYEQIGKRIYLTDADYLLTEGKESAQNFVNLV
jgi:hypothetical protein